MQSFYMPYEAGSAIPEERYSEAHYSDDALLRQYAAQCEEDDDA